MLMTNRIKTIAAAALLLTAGCGGASEPAPVQAENRMDEFEVELAEIVEDEGRCEEIYAAVDDVRDVTRRGIEQRRNYVRRMVELHKDYNTAREDFNALFRENQEARTAFRQELYAFRSRLVENTTVEEWEELKTLRHDALAAALVAVTESPVVSEEQEEN